MAGTGQAQTVLRVQAMYTVLRFSTSGSLEQLSQLGAELNAVAPGLYTGMDRVPNRFSCDVETSDGCDWGLHRDAILRFLRTCGCVIARARQQKISIQFDVAVEPEDYESANVTGLLVDTDLSRALSAHDVELGFSIYSGRVT